MQTPLTRCRSGAFPASVGFLALIGVLTPAAAATTQDRYYAHAAVQDRDGVIAPWYSGQRGLPHFHDGGMVEDNIDGGQITAREWSELIGLGPILCGLEILAWLPEVFGPARENHLVRSTSTVNAVAYGPGRIEYTTFDAPAPNVDVLRLAFRPREVQADGRGLPLREELSGNGFSAKKLACGDWLVTVRHDGAKFVRVLGDDSQTVADDDGLTYEAAWAIDADPNDFGGKCHVTETAGAAMVHRFQGNQVRLIGRADPSGGLADVYLDGIKQRVGIDCWTPGTRKSQQVFDTASTPRSSGSTSPWRRARIACG